MAAPQTELIVLKASEEIGRYALEPGVYTIGCSSSCSIQIDVPGISRQHAQLSVAEDGGLSLQDLGSSHGSMVDEQPVNNGSAVSVLPNQTISLGSAVSLLVQQQSVPAEGSDVSLAEEELGGLPPELQSQDRYEVGEQIAKGGMGAILQARESAARRTVAMKVILGAAEESPRHRLRFIEEAQITAQLEHPNIVPVHDVGADAEGRIFYTMKLVKGITLKKILELLKKGAPGTVQKYPLANLLTIFQKVCDAVAFAHSKGVIHRDLKPENIMIGSYGEVLVMDWGLAKLIGRTSGTEVSFEVASARFDEGESHATMDGSVMGTPSYMAPEQARGEVEKLDQRTDIFSLGVILYEILTLERPFTGKNGREVIERVLSGEPPIGPNTFNKRKKEHKLLHLTGGEVPESLSAVAMRAVASTPEARYDNVKLLQEDLLAYQTGFATVAEEAGVWKQIKLFVRRNRAISLSSTLILSLIVASSTKLLIDRDRLVAERNRAEGALHDLRKQAPALRELAQAEASLQHFESSQIKIDAALAIDPNDLPSYWVRAFSFIGMDRIQDAAQAIKVARQKDPGRPDLAVCESDVDRLASLPVEQRWRDESGRRLYNFLLAHGATGEAIAVSSKLQASLQDNLILVRRRLGEWFGKDSPIVNRARLSNGGVDIDLKRTSIDSLEMLRGLPISSLSIGYTKVSSLEPLRGMRLVELWANQTPITDLTPVQGMPLTQVAINRTKISDLRPLTGAPITMIDCDNLNLVDFTPIENAPIKTAKIERNALGNLSFLSKAPLEELYAYGNRIVDLSALRGKQIKVLMLPMNQLADLSPLSGMPLCELDVHGNASLKDLSPLLTLEHLEKLRVSRLGNALAVLRQHKVLKYIGFDDDPYLPVEDFWKAYDARMAAEKK